MPKLGAEPIRKAALINAAIVAVGRTGSLDVTVAQIAREAGMSPALAHHYFGSKDQMFLAAMRHVLNTYRDAVRERLPRVLAPRARLDAIIAASFDETNFQQEVISAWLNFYALSRVNEQAARLLRVYHRRLRSNLMVALRELSPRPERVADTLAALIDGVYLRAALGRGPADGAAAIRMISDYLNEALT